VSKRKTFQQKAMLQKARTVKAVRRKKIKKFHVTTAMALEQWG